MGDLIWGAVPTLVQVPTISHNSRIFVPACSHDPISLETIIGDDGAWAFGGGQEIESGMREQIDNLWIKYGLPYRGTAISFIRWLSSNLANGRRRINAVVVTGGTNQNSIILLLFDIYFRIDFGHCIDGPTRRTLESELQVTWRYVSVPLWVISEAVGHKGICGGLCLCLLWCRWRWWWTHSQKGDLVNVVPLLFSQRQVWIRFCYF